jgi:hypothetical protein
MWFARTFPIRFLVPVLIGLGSASASATAQDTILVRGGPSCAGCSIEVRRAVRLGKLADPTGPGDYVWAARHSTGAVYVSPSASHDSFLRYGPDGGFDREIGRSGQGPGEFTYAGAISLGPGDTLHIFDHHSRIWSLFTPSGDFARQIRLRVRVDAVVHLPAGRMIVQGESAAPPSIGLPAHLVDRDGTVIRSFGVLDPVVDPRTPFDPNYRSLGPASAGRVWLAYWHRYQLERWTIDGRLESVVIRDVDWFRTRDIDQPGGSPLFIEPKSELHAVWEDSDGLIWTISRVATEDWEPEGPAPSGPQRMPAVSDRARYYDAVIEVIDLEAARVVAATRLRNVYFQRFVEPGLMIARSGEPSGLAYVDVYELRLDKPPQ